MSSVMLGDIYIYTYDDNESIAAAISRWRTIWVYPGRSIYTHFVAILMGYSHDQ